MVRTLATTVIFRILVRMLLLVHAHRPRRILVLLFLQVATCTAYFETTTSYKKKRKERKRYKYKTRTHACQRMYPREIRILLVFEGRRVLDSVGVLELQHCISRHINAAPFFAS